MNLFILAFFILSHVYLIGASSICYENYGCFNDDDLFLPEEPEKVNTTFYLFNRMTNSGGEKIQQGSFVTFKKNLETKIIIIGFMGNSTKPWILQMKDELLKIENVNVIIVDWSAGNGHPYSKSVGNTQIVGIDLANLLLSIMAEYNSIKPSNFHLIGYSLGAHIAGIAGSKLPGIRRITGLDPASLYYKEKSKEFKLDSSDADFVDVIHTDTSTTGMGISDQIGHVDFYPNGGESQPGCDNFRIFNTALTWIFEGQKEANAKFACSHRSARKFFIDSISQKCKYTAYPCKDYETFEDGECLKCTSSGCNQMGYWASKSADNGKLYLNTRGVNHTDSYCLEHYKIKLLSNNQEGQSKARGKFKVFWKIKDYVSPTFLMKDDTITLKTNQETNMMATIKKSAAGEIEEVFVSYKRTSNYFKKYFYDQYWSFKYVEVLEGSTQKSVKFCPLLTKIKSGTTGIFKKCPE